MNRAVTPTPPALAGALVGAALLASRLSFAQEAALGESLEGLLAYARERHPELRAMRYEADAATQRIDPAGALPDPMFKTELQNITNYGNDAAPSLSPAKVGSTKYTFSQVIPFWGKRDLRQGVAEADALQADRRVNATWAELAAKIKVAYAQYQLAARSEELAREVLTLMGSLESLAQARYASGLVPQQDAIRAQVEQTGMRTDLVMLGSEKRQWQVKLNSLLTRPAGAPVADPRRTRALPPPARLDPAVLADRLPAGNPLLAVEDARIQSAERGRELDLPQPLSGLQRRRFADPDGQPDQRMGVDGRGQYPSAAGHAPRAGIRGRIDALSRPIAQGSRLAAGARGTGRAPRRPRCGAAHRRLITTHLLPQASLTLQSALAAYENGRVDFATLLEAQRQIRKAKQDREKANAEAQMRLAEIERLVGEDL